MSTQLFPYLTRASDSDNAPYSGARWSFFEGSTTTPATVYADSAAAVPFGAVVTADSGGKFPEIYLDDAKIYRAVLTNADGSVTIYDISRINAAPTATAIAYSPPGSSITSDIGTVLSRVIHQSDYPSYAAAKLAAGNDRPLFCYPQTNAGLGGADTQIGLRIGHTVIGGTFDDIDDPDAFVTLVVQETYANVEQEIRVGSLAGRYYRRNSIDEATLGWDLRILTATGVIDGRNNEYLRGNLNPFTAEMYFNRPAVGDEYAARNTYLYSTYLEVAERVTLENFEAMVIKAPVGSPTEGTGVIKRMQGIVIQNLAQFIAPVEVDYLAAIRLEGAAESGRIWWGNLNWITADLSGKLEISANGKPIALKNIESSTAATAGAGGALPATVRNYIHIIDSTGVLCKIPTFEA